MIVTFYSCCEEGGVGAGGRITLFRRRNFGKKDQPSLRRRKRTAIA